MTRTQSTDAPVLETNVSASVPRVARLKSVDPNGVVRVDVPGYGEISARLLSSVSRRTLERASEGRELLVLMENGDPAKPIVVGILEDPVRDIMDDNDERVIEARGSITLVCGEASLTLHADGRVVTRGVNVVSVASEQQRIQGAVVRIN
jgi:hypothetical protein